MVLVTQIWPGHDLDCAWPSLNEADDEFLFMKVWLILHQNVLIVCSENNISQHDMYFIFDGTHIFQYR